MCMINKVKKIMLLKTTLLVTRWFHSFILTHVFSIFPYQTNVNITTSQKTKFTEKKQISNIRWYCSKIKYVKSILSCHFCKRNSPFAIWNQQLRKTTGTSRVEREPIQTALRHIDRQTTRASTRCKDF